MINQKVCDGLRPTFGHRYHIQEKLSDKAGRQTYLARDSEQNEQVIIKILNFDAALTWEHFKLFEREAKTLQNLSHPAIPKYQDYLDLDSENCKGFALVQTYIKAQSLESYLQSGRTFSEVGIRQFAESLLDILTYLHNQNPPVIHRDLKPSNILLGDRSGNHIGQVYLVDFGSVQTIASKESGTITIVGSYGYIPFEQFCGQAVPASDLYSLGMTLLYLATGVHPADLPQKQGEVQIRNTGLSHSLEQWLKQMTNSRLDRRFPNAQLALKALIHDQAVNLSSLKPSCTGIQLKHTYDMFEIIIPKYRAFTFANAVFFVVAFMCFGWILVLVAIPAVVLREIFLFGSADRQQSRKIERMVIDKWMVIDENTVTGYTWFGRKITCPRSQINRLCYSSSYTFNHYWDSDRKKN